MLRSGRVLTIVLGTGLLSGDVHPGTGDPLFSDDYEWRQIAESVYVHSQRDTLAGPIDGNSTVVVSERDVIVVDAHIGPHATQDLLNRIQSVTDNPVTYLINTHWHDDHVNGNYLVADAYPSVEIVAHPYTLTKLRNEWAEFLRSRVSAYSGLSFDELNTRAREFTEEGKELRALDIKVFSQYAKELKDVVAEIKPVLPTVTVETALRLERSRFPIEIVHLGEGNTSGDLVVWLPDQGILITGDILTHPVPFAFSSPVSGWITTLARIEEMEPAQIVPGHGIVQENLRHLRLVKRALTELSAQVATLISEGRDKKEIPGLVDMRSMEHDFTGGELQLRHAWSRYFVEPGVQSVLELHTEQPGPTRALQGR